MKESELEKILRDEVKKLGGRAYKWVSPGNDGVPDRIVVFPERQPVFVELKTDKGKLSTLQKAQINKLEELGQCTEVVYGINGLIEFFRKYGYPGTSKMLAQRYNL